MSKDDLWGSDQGRTVLRRAGIRVIYSAKEGEKVAPREDGKLLVVHPERKPKIVAADGSETEIDMDPAEAFATIVNWQRENFGRT